jgi:hypothetical protein
VERIAHLYHPLEVLYRSRARFLRFEIVDELGHLGAELGEREHASIRRPW